MEEASKNSNCGFGKIRDNSIAQLKAAVDNMRLNIKKTTIMKMKKLAIIIGMMLLVGQVDSHERFNVKGQKIDCEISILELGTHVVQLDNEYLTLCSAKGNKLFTYSEGKLYLGDSISNDALICEIKGDRLLINKKECAVFRGVGLYGLDGREVASLNGTKIKCMNDIVAILDGNKLCDKDTGETMMFFNKTPQIKELLTVIAVIAIYGMNGK